MMKSGVRLGLSLVLMVAALAAGSAQGGDKKIVFVCEHGAAKSDIVPCLLALVALQ